MKKLLLFALFGVFVATTIPVTAEAFICRCCKRRRQKCCCPPYNAFSPCNPCCCCPCPCPCPPPCPCPCPPPPCMGGCLEPAPYYGPPSSCASGCCGGGCLPAPVAAHHPTPPPLPAPPPHAVPSPHHAGPTPLPALSYYHYHPAAAHMQMASYNMGNPNVVFYPLPYPPRPYPMAHQRAPQPVQPAGYQTGYGNYRNYYQGYQQPIYHPWMMQGYHAPYNPYPVMPVPYGRY